MSQITTPIDVDDFLRGANFMSASGGGDPVVEREQLNADLEAGREIGWVPLDTIDPDGHDLLVCFSGSIAPESFDDPRSGRRRSAAAGCTTTRSSTRFGCSRTCWASNAPALVSIEIGGINAGAILSASSRCGLPLVDGDYAGRAIPSSTRRRRTCTTSPCSRLRASTISATR